MMSATTTTRSVTTDFSDYIAAGAPVPQLVKPGEIDPRATHYGYSAGEHEIQPRQAATGHASILPGQLIPLRVFKRNVPNDTMEALGAGPDDEVKQERTMEVTPRDAADTLMARYQHRGFRIFMPLVGMKEIEAVRLFSLVHPKRPCIVRPPESKEFKRLRPFDQAILARHCVACRIDYMRSDEMFERMEQAKLSTEPTIEFGLSEDGDGVRFISEQEAVTILHESILSGLDEHFEHMISTLMQSKADVEAGKSGPGKKKYDKRDEWYFLMAHKSPNDIEAAETAARMQGEALADRVGSVVAEAMSSAKGGGLSVADVQALLKEQEDRLRKEFATKGAKGKDKETPPQA